MDRKNTGLTLIESLVVVAIMSVLAGSVYIVFKSGMDAWLKSEAHLEIYQNARAILDQLSRDLPGAFVEAGATLGDGPVFKGVDGGASPDYVIFTTNYADSFYTIGYVHDSFFGQTNNVLRRPYIENQAFNNTLPWVWVDFGFKVSDIDFDYWDGSVWVGSGTWNNEDVLPGAVKVKLKLKEKPTDDDAKAYRFETIIYLPNSE